MIYTIFIIYYIYEFNTFVFVYKSEDVILFLYKKILKSVFKVLDKRIKIEILCWKIIKSDKSTC